MSHSITVEIVGRFFATIVHRNNAIIRYILNQLEFVKIAIKKFLNQNDLHPNHQESILRIIFYIREMILSKQKKVNQELR